MRIRVGLALVGMFGIVSCHWGLPPPTSYDGQGDNKAQFCEQLSDSANGLFVGEEVIAWSTGVAAAVAGALGATLDNDPAGNTWDKNRKYILLTPVVPLGALSTYFFSAASNASHASGQADQALALTSGFETDGGVATDLDAGGRPYRVAFQACAQAAGYWKAGQTDNNSVAEAQLKSGVSDAGH